jgi:hypothetical protein
MPLSSGGSCTVAGQLSVGGFSDVPRPRQAAPLASRRFTLGPWFRVAQVRVMHIRLIVGDCYRRLPRSNEGFTETTPRGVAPSLRPGVDVRCVANVKRSTGART